MFHAFLLTLALLVAPRDGGLSTVTPESPQQSFPVGERLVYRGTVEKAGITLEVGKAVFTAASNDDGETILTATARGAKFGYTLDTTITARLEEGSVTPIEYHYVQRGSEQREKKLVFSENGAQYWKLKHCRLKGCTEREHEVKKVRWKGIFPWGTKRVHCDARHCRVPEHHIWVLRQEHRFERPYFDLLTAIYTARQISLVPGSAGTTVAVINDGDRWLVKVTARREKRLQVRAGTFDAVELILDPVSEEGTDVNEKFSGLFGLNGSISVWVDRKTNRPILVKGTLPFAFMDLQATVELTEVSSEVQVSGSGKAKEKRGE